MSSSPPVILHLNFSRGWRGGEYQTALLHQGLMDRGWPSFVLARAGHEFEQRALAQSLPNVYTVRTKSLKAGEIDPGLALAVRDVARRTGAQVVHAHSAHAGGIALLARILYQCRLPLVIERAVTDPIGFFSRWKYNAADAIIAVCGAIKEGLVERGVEADKVKVIPIGLPLPGAGQCGALAEDKNGLDSRFRGNDEEGRGNDGMEIRFGTLCALDRTQKDVETLLRAYAAFRAENPDFRSRLIVFGEGKDRVRLEFLTGELGLRPHVDFRGWWAGEIGDVMKQLDIFILSSLKEGTSNVLLGAMAAGLPCIATAAGGTPELLDQAGILVPPRNPLALAGAMKYVADSERLWEELGRQAKLRSQNYSLKRMLEATIACYEDVLKKDKYSVRYARAGGHPEHSGSYGLDSRFRGNDEANNDKEAIT